MNLTDILAIWGAILSTILGAFKIWEIYRDRRRILVSYRFGSTDDGNKIILKNPSKTPIMIDDYEPFWSKCRFLRKRSFFEFAFPEDSPRNLTIDPHSRLVLNFSGINYFNPYKTEKGNLYIRLHLTGKKWPTILRVYP